MGSLAKRIPGISVEQTTRDEAKQIQENYKELAAEEKVLDPKAFQYDEEARYQAGAASPKSVESLVIAIVLVQPARDKGFSVQYTDVFEKYLMPPVKTDSMIKTWSSNPMQFWQNQLNFAVWCATTACGVSLEDHLTTSDPLM